VGDVVGCSVGDVVGGCVGCNVGSNVGATEVGLTVVGLRVVGPRVKTMGKLAVGPRISCEAANKRARSTVATIRITEIKGVTECGCATGRRGPDLIFCPKAKPLGAPHEREDRSQKQRQYEIAKTPDTLAPGL
jgi:hypothetical protein